VVTFRDDLVLPYAPQLGQLGAKILVELCDRVGGILLDFVDAIQVLLGDVTKMEVVFE
jgi:hypothetical protein